MTGIVRLKQNKQNKSGLKQELVVCRSESLEHLKVFVFGCNPVFIKKRFLTSALVGVFYSVNGGTGHLQLKHYFLF